jgi:hypothetical protein
MGAMAKKTAGIQEVPTQSRKVRTLQSGRALLRRRTKKDALAAKENDDDARGVETAEGEAKIVVSTNKKGRELNGVALSRYF